MARIDALLAKGRTFSFEFMPPKNDVEQVRLARTLLELQPLQPSFVSVTYRGGRSSRERTHNLVAGMLTTTTLTPMAHLICAGHTRLELADILVQLRKAGVENLMAIRGDAPTDPAAPVGELPHAIDLVELARAIGGFSVGVAAHPAGHPQCASLEEDRLRLVEKLRVADFAVTQFFFEPVQYLRLVDDLARLGMDKPVIPGIMPITSLVGLARTPAMGVVAPGWLADQLQTAGDAAAVRRAGIEAACRLCQTLLDAGAPGLHFYTLNRSSATREIFVALGLAPRSVTEPDAVSRS